VWHVTIEKKGIAIKYIYTNKVIIVSLIKPTPSDAFKTHVLSLGIRKVQHLDVSCFLMDMFFLQRASM